MMTTLTITLPHTPRCLSPNAKAPLTPRGGPGGGIQKDGCQEPRPEHSLGPDLRSPEWPQDDTDALPGDLVLQGTAPGCGQLPCLLQGVPGRSLQGPGH